jgi:hypothetical protein
MPMTAPWTTKLFATSWHEATSACIQGTAWSQRRLHHARAALLISAALTAYWYQQPGAFPHTLSNLGNWVIDSLGIHTADASADAEAIYVALVSLLLALLLVSAVTMIMRLFRGSEMGHAATRSVPSGRGGVESAPHQ